VPASRLSCEKLGLNPPLPYNMTMAENWVEYAQKLAEAARARVAADRKRLQKILAERQGKSAPKQSKSQ
jgi:hypothetical protein